MADVHNTYIKFVEKYDDTVYRQVGSVNIGCGLVVDTHEMKTPPENLVRYQHIVRVASLEDDDVHGNGLLWRIDNDNADPAGLVTGILTAVYHGICGYPDCYTEADKTNLATAQQLLLDDTGPKKYCDTFTNKDIMEDAVEMGVQIGTIISSIRYRKDTVQEVSWLVKSTVGDISTTRTFTTTKVFHDDIVLLSMKDLEKEYKERIAALFN